MKTPIQSSTINIFKKIAKSYVQHVWLSGAILIALSLSIYSLLYCFATENTPDGFSFLNLLEVFLFMGSPFIAATITSLTKKTQKMYWGLSYIPIYSIALTLCMKTLYWFGIPVDYGADTSVYLFIGILCSILPVVLGTALGFIISMTLKIRARNKLNNDYFSKQNNILK